MEWFLIVAMTNVAGMTSIFPTDGAFPDLPKCMQTARLMEHQLLSKPGPQGSSVHAYCVDKPQFDKLSKR